MTTPPTPVARPDEPDGRSSPVPQEAPDVAVATWVLLVALLALAAGVLFTLR